MDFEGYQWTLDNRFEAKCSGGEYSNHRPEEFELVRTKDTKHRAGSCPFPGCERKFVSRIRGFGYEK